MCVFCLRGKRKSLFGCVSILRFVLIEILAGRRGTRKLVFQMQAYRGEEISTIYSEFCFDHFHRPRGGTRNGRLVAFRMLVAYAKKDGLLLAS